MFSGFLFVVTIQSFLNVSIVTQFEMWFAMTAREISTLVLSHVQPPQGFRVLKWCSRCQAGFCNVKKNDRKN